MTAAPCGVLFPVITVARQHRTLRSHPRMTSEWDRRLAGLDRRDAGPTLELVPGRLLTRRASEDAPSLARRVSENLPCRGNIWRRTAPVRWRRPRALSVLR